MTQAATFLATNVPSGTANILSYMMLVVVAIYLLTGTSITYYYWRKNKRAKESASPTEAPATPGPEGGNGLSTGERS